MLQATKEFDTDVHLDLQFVLHAIAGEAAVINRTHNDAIRPALDEMLAAAQTWIDVSFPQLQAPIKVGRSGSHVWVHHIALGKRVLIITDESARKAA